MKKPTKAETRKAIDRLLEIEAKRRGTKPACEMCRFWSMLKRTPSDKSNTKGECRRSPPIPVAQTHLLGTGWCCAVTYSWHWCGEFEEKKP